MNLIHPETFHYIKPYPDFYDSMQPSPYITPNIIRSSKRHTRKIISINPIKKFITRNLIRSRPPLRSSAENTTLKSPKIHQGPMKKLKSLHKNRLAKYVLAQ